MKYNNNTKPLAELVFIKAIRENIEKKLIRKYRSRIDHLIGANNELMKELEKYNSSDSLSSEESQIVMMPWLKGHIKE
jgi:DNA repair ATPase RecN